MKEGVILAYLLSFWVEAMDDAKHPIIHGKFSLAAKNYSALNANTDKAEKPCNKLLPSAARLNIFPLRFLQYVT